MKKIYLMLFMVVSVGLYAQDTIDINNLDNDEITGFKLYPNPAIEDVVYVTTQQNSLKEIRVYDVFGELVLTDKLSAKALNISKLSPGVYVVQVTENNKSITRKLVVK
ncbi:T9SS type A sorting domain-containing protein [Maribacter dokdonensis]|uniref:T9SS type A sorting domain-containing protein n=1 Tax=Maribacter dokdonensis TaxID=320912 RepID=UPI001C07F3C8|nr:T9SS type A sorting domain-containing protein [Maribacter dokdonensis]MBU2900974.1 T9SS type A sorting domain-containing protein [Maribacter dokdonensis]